MTETKAVAPTAAATPAPQFRVPLIKCLEDAWRCAKIFANSRIGRGMSVEDIFAQICLGHEYRMGPMIAMTHLYWVGSNLEPDGPAIASLLHQAGVEFDFLSHDEKGAIIQLTGPDGKVRKPITWNEADSKRARLIIADPKTGEQKFVGPGWEKFPRDMYRWRCLTFAAREQFPHILGALHMPEEMGCLDVNENGAPVNQVKAIEAAITGPEVPQKQLPTEEPKVIDRSVFRPPTDQEILEDPMYKARDKAQIAKALGAMKLEFDKIGDASPWQYIEETFGCHFGTNKKGEKVRVRNDADIRRATFVAINWRDDNMDLWLKEAPKK